MHKVYLLLRNNKQEGPYSLEEILSLGLKPYDLIWVEGRSFSWSHPSEVEALKPHIAAEAPTQKPIPIAREEHKTEPIASSTSSKKVFVSLPGNKERTAAPVQTSEPQAIDIERKAEELRKRAESYLQSKSAVGEEFTETKYSRSLNEVEEDYTSWVYNKVSKKKSNKKPLVLTATAVFVLVSGYFVINAMSSKDETNTAAASKPVNTIEKIEKEEREESTVSVNNIRPEEEYKGAVNQGNAIVKKGSSTKKGAEKESKVSANTPKPKAYSSIPAPTTANADAPQETAQTEIDNSPNRNTSEPIATQPEAKKKTLKEKIGGFFEKIKSKKTEGAETGEEQPTPGTTTNGSERKATKRGESETASGGSADLSSFVKVSTNQSSGNWMMGVRGLKIILRNNGSEAIKTAVVEVRYYNDENSLLDKKLVQFTNVPAKKSATQSAPDHRLADHTEVNLVSAVGDVGYAKQ